MYMKDILIYNIEYDIQFSLHNIITRQFIYFFIIFNDT